MLSVSTIIFSAVAVIITSLRDYLYERKFGMLVDKNLFKDRKVRYMASALYILCVPLLLTRVEDAEQWLAGMLALVLAYYTAERTSDFLEEVHYSVLAGPDDVISYVKESEKALPLNSVEETFGEFCERIEEEADEYEKAYKK